MKLTTTLWFFSNHPIKVKLYLGLKYYTCLLRGPCGHKTTRLWISWNYLCEAIILAKPTRNSTPAGWKYTCSGADKTTTLWFSLNIFVYHNPLSLIQLGVCFCFCFCSVHHNWVGELLSSSEKQFGEQSQISLTYFINFMKVTKDQWYCVAAVLSSVHVLEYSLEQVWHRLFWTLLGLTNCSFLSVYLCACQLNFCARLKLLETQNGHRTATLCQIWN